MSQTPGVSLENAVAGGLPAGQMTSASGWGLAYILRLRGGPPLSRYQAPSLPKPRQLRFSEKPSRSCPAHEPSCTPLPPPAALRHDMLTLGARLVSTVAMVLQHPWDIGGRAPTWSRQSEQGVRVKSTPVHPWLRVWSRWRRLQARPGTLGPEEQ